MRILNVLMKKWRKMNRQIVTKYGDVFIVSDFGDIFKASNMFQYKIQTYKTGYCFISTCKRKYLVHRLVAQAFLDDYSEEVHVHHIDEDKSNNNVNNLHCINKLLHQKLHKTIYPKTKNCVVCGKEFEPLPTKRKRNKVCSEECRIKYIKATRVKYQRSINQFSKDNVLIKTWDSLKEIESELGFYCSNIVKCCQGKINTYKGYIWRYNDE